jgi:hypothetical protein
MTLNGDFSNSGTFTHSNGTLTIAPTNSTLTSNVLGSSNTTFYNLTNNTPGSTLQFKAGNTYTFANVLTLNGAEGNPVSINSDSSGAQWLMTLSGTSSITYLKVKDSGCSGGNTISASDSVYDYGNNGICWTFISPGFKKGGNSLESSSSAPSGQGTGGSSGGSGGGGASFAIATAVVSSNVVQSVTINYGGTGYTSVPTVLFCGGGGSGALGTAVLTGDVVTSVTVDNGGSGYSSAPTVVFNSNCPTTGGSGGGDTGGDIGFLYQRRRFFALYNPIKLTIFNFISQAFTSQNSL